MIVYYIVIMVVIMWTYQNSCLIFWKLLNLTGLKAVEHLAIVTLFLDIASVM